MQVLKLFWWQRGPRFGNFGDELSHWIVERLSGRTVVCSSLATADLTAIGSLLEPHLTRDKSWSDFHGVIWGSGRMFPAERLDLTRAQVTAVRGRHTLDHVHVSDVSRVVFGDPGLLVGDFCPRSKPTTLLGVFPHWSELRHPFFRSPLCQQAGVEVIDPCASIDETLARLARCRHILSSAMHGLIVADTLGIPHQWLRLRTGNEDVAGYPAFKYHDYFSALQRETPKPLMLRGDENLGDLLRVFSDYVAPKLDTIQHQLRRAFPFGR